MIYRLILLISFATFSLSSCSEDTPTNKNTDPAAYTNASVSNGGILYDKFWASESDFDQTNQHLATLSANGDFFRCKQCHAWDLLGTEGSYNGRGPKTNRPNVSSKNLFAYAQSKTAQEIFDALKTSTDRRDISHDLSTYDPATNATEGDKMPNLSQLLTDSQLWDLVKFLKTGAFDVTKLYDASYTGTYPTGKVTFSNVGKDGNEANGLAYYKVNCEVCHGADGKTLTMENMSAGKFIRSKPNEVQHKVKYGQLGSPMSGKYDISLEQMKDLYKALSNTTNFPD